MPVIKDTSTSRAAARVFVAKPPRPVAPRAALDAASISRRLPHLLQQHLARVFLFRIILRRRQSKLFVIQFRDRLHHHIRLIRAARRPR